MKSENLHQHNTQGWDAHYKRSRSFQLWPDENLVRMLAVCQSGPVLDLGCGSGRHLNMLFKQGFDQIFGVDTSKESIAICQQNYPKARTCLLETRAEVFPDLNSLFAIQNFQTIIAWGVLHYNQSDLQHALLQSISKSLAPDGYFLGTLRAKSDTHYQLNPDINATPIEYFSEQDTRTLLGLYFKHVELGYSERSPIGELDQRVCHWIFRCHNE